MDGAAHGSAPAAPAATSRAHLPVVLIIGGCVVAVAGVVIGVTVATRQRTRCADSNIYRLVNLVCHDVRRTYPHLVIGLVITVALLLAGAAAVFVGVVQQRRRVPRST